MVLPLVNALALFSLGYLLGENQPKPAPPSDDYAPPYTPPFTGGQCVGKGYRAIAQITVVRKDGSSFSFSNDTGAFASPLRKIESKKEADGRWSLLRECADPSQNFFNPSWYSDSSWESLTATFSVQTTDGSPDNCGNLPNPNPPIPSSSSGLASDGFDPSAEPNTELAAPIVPFLPSFLAALNAALAAAAAAANALDAIKAVADAIASIADLLKKIREDLNEKEKGKDKNKEVLSYRFGDIEKDGFLRLYPSASFDDCEASQLDILIKSIPIGYGKYFGRFSPNYFEYKRLGHIAFVSGSFGIIERKFIEFGRSSFSIPKGSIGFYYHLGLDGVIKADASAIYLREVEQIE